MPLFFLPLASILHFFSLYYSSLFFSSLSFCCFNIYIFYGTKPSCPCCCCLSSVIFHTCSSTASPAFSLTYRWLHAVTIACFDVRCLHYDESAELSSEPAESESRRVSTAAMEAAALRTPISKMKPSASESRITSSGCCSAPAPPESIGF